MSLSNTLKEQNEKIKHRELLCEEEIEASKHLQQNKFKEMTDKKRKKEVDEWKAKTRKLGYENLLLKRKRKRDELKIKKAKKYQKLERDCSYLLTIEKER